MKTVLAWIAAAAVLAGGASAIAQPSAPDIVVKAAVPAPLFTYQEVMVAMRDGVRLQTVIMTPTNAKGPLPILLRRSPYGVPDKAYTDVPDPLKQLYEDGYIFVIQNIRGRFKSEGTFSLSQDVTVTPGKGTIETRDAYDTVDWLVKNVAGNNGRVGIYGVSYDGYTAGATLLGPHPALKAVSEQASPVDQWMNDDDHRYGALRLSYDFEYAVYEEADKNANTHFAFDKWDTYEWYLAAGPLSTLNENYTHGKIRYWNETIEHPDYDDFWKNQAWVQALHASTVPNLNVAGFWDQEDPWGPWQIYRHASLSDPKHTNLMVAGPWYHGAWRRSVSTLGATPLGQDTSLAFRENIEAPFFAYWLHDKGMKPAWAATMFQTGSNIWKTYAAWPPAAAKPTSLYFHADGTLSFAAPGPGEAGAHRDYVSDPANPVPYRARPISPTYPAGDWRTWESADQRFVDHRPDVLTYVSAPLSADLTVSGPVAAELFASTSGSDSDFIVKLIDVAPDDAQKPAWSADDGPLPGMFAHSANGYELPIAMEVRRGRYLSSFEHPHALTPNKPVKWDVPLRDRDHVFKAGHRIMVQVQSTWFPLIDRNPQTFTPSIYAANAGDFVAATQKVYAAPDMASRIVLPVVAGGG
ncbi:CocE/NonD family hydrolase [Phenylobacterium sp.]|uniref:CocE/NonD family hydrolase n=1 Tax=Phenylobacterium sp. TaxID=1871053 RepID=UPI0011F64761|nr:CocE/NonD family hydrolase [Phenylobacterium sp.]THD61676.1 MAG: CocE/NonD family hydrolase [Phenylobacterium sp.]